jgi:Protein of unknown function (DUF1677)
MKALGHTIHKLAKALTRYIYIYIYIHTHSSPLLGASVCLREREREREEMDVESVKCECCGLKEDCTKGYISQIKSNFEDTWLCGLCSEAVRDELERGPSARDLKGAIRSHKSFCQRTPVCPAMGVADAVKQMLRRRSGEIK